MIDPARDRGTDAGTQSEELMELVLRSAAIARERIVAESERVKAYVIREPARALGIALAMGVLIGWVIKRR
jgi:hypothetical protein